MSSEILVPLVLGVMAVLIFIEVPVAFAMGIAGLLGLVLLRDWGYATNVLGGVPFDQTNSFSLTVIPLFILLGVFVVKARVASDAFQVARYILRRVPGGLGAATVMACAGFAAVSGSSVASVATMSNISIGEMRKAGYSDTLASGIVAVAGTLGTMIPPSVLMIIYAMLSGESTGKMLIAGIIPGILSAVFYTAYIVAVQGKRPDEGKSLTGLDREAEPRLSTLPWGGLVKIAVIFIIVVGGIYSGLVTVTESAAVGALAAFVIFIQSNIGAGIRDLWCGLKVALASSAETTTKVFAIVIGSGLLSSFFVISRVPQSLTSWVSALDASPTLIMVLMLLLLIPLGMFLESISMLVIVVPLIQPVATSLGYDGIWLGIMIIKMVEVGLITPPIGISCFVVSATAEIPINRVFRGILPFLLVEAAILVTLFSFPQISLWLPSTMR